jgi:hypothetical protein
MIKGESVMKNFVCLSSVIAFTALAVGPTSHAATTWQSGMACLAYIENDAGLVRAAAGHWIGTSDSAAGHIVTCPVPNNQATVDQASARLEYSEVSSVSSISATVRFYNESTGSLSSTGWKYSCATAGGCTTANHAWSGSDGYLSWGNVLGAMTGSPSIVIDATIGKTDPGEFGFITQYQVTY